MDIATLLTGTTDPSDQRIIDSINNAQTGEPVPARQSAPASLGQQDFLRLLTVQLQQQDPFAPVDNTDMLAQMAQFSSLAGSNETNATLTDIATKLDALIAAQPTQTTPNQQPAETTP